MSSFLRCNVSFRIYNNNLDPKELTEMLCIEPDVSHKKGDLNTSINERGDLIEFSPYSSGLWSIISKEDEHAPLEEHINSLLRLLEPSKDRLNELFNRNYKTDIFCGLFAHDCHQPGFDINSNIMKRLGELNIDLGMCFYYHNNF